MAAEVFGKFFFFTNRFIKLSKTTQGGISISIIEAFRYISEFIIILITARLLAPDDFGLVALSISFISIIDALTDLGIKTAVIQSKNNSLKFLSCAWSMILIRAILVFIILLLSSNLIAEFYQKPEIQLIIIVLALRTLFQALINPYLIYNIKSLEYKNYTIMMLTSTTSKLIIIIPAAFIMQNYWVLILGSLISPFIKVITSYCIDKRYIIPTLNFEHAKIILRFSLWMLFSRLSLISIQNIPRLVIAKLFDFTVVGGFKLSEQLGYFINNILKKFSSMIILPYFSKKFRSLNKKTKRIAEEYISLIFLLVIPICIFASFSAKALIYILFGENWLFIEKMLIYMIVYGSILTISNMLFPLIVAFGKPSKESKSRFIALLILLIFIILDHSLDGILNGLLLSGLVMLFFAIFDLLKLNIIKISRQIKLLFIDNIPLLAALIPYFFLNNFYDALILNFLFVNIISISVYVLSALILHQFFNRGVFTYLKKFLN